MGSITVAIQANGLTPSALAPLYSALESASLKFIAVILKPKPLPPAHCAARRPFQSAPPKARATLKGILAMNSTKLGASALTAASGAMVGFTKTADGGFPMYRD